MICPRGRFPILQYNKVCDITASLHAHRGIHHCCIPVTSHTLALHSANTDDGTHLDICVRGFWNMYYVVQMHFDIRVFHLNMPMTAGTPQRAFQKTYINMPKLESMASMYVIGTQNLHPHYFVHFWRHEQ